MFLRSCHVCRNAYSRAMYTFPRGKKVTKRDSSVMEAEVCPVDVDVIYCIQRIQRFLMDLPDVRSTPRKSWPLMLISALETHPDPPPPIWMDTRRIYRCIHACDRPRPKKMGSKCVIPCPIRQDLDLKPARDLCHLKDASVTLGNDSQ